jgi:hypothetical protein
MANTAFKRVGMNKVSAMLVAKDSPTGWNDETLLCRFMESNGAETAFILTQEALTAFQNCEIGRIYDLEINGSCVKPYQGMSKFGVPACQEIRARLHCKIQLSKSAWPAKPQYNFIEWETLNQKQNGDFVDILGRVTETPALDPISKLSKMTVPLTNGTQNLPVDFLGSHSNIPLQKNDIVIVRTAVIKEWRQTRTLQTTYLSVIEVNPVSSDSIPKIDALDNDEPKQKALRMTPQTVFTIAQVMDVMSTMENDANELVRDICMRGSLTQLTNSFFDGDAPIIQVSEGKEKMCLTAEVGDATGNVIVKLWDFACYDIFHVTAPKLKDFWEKGVEDEEEKATVLEELNKSMDVEFRLFGTIKLWKFGFKEVNHKAQININSVERL